MIRRWLSVGACFSALVALVGPQMSSEAAPATVAAGFVDSAVAAIGATTAVGSLPDGTVVVLTQNGTVRLVRDGSEVPAPALNISGKVCLSAERGLLGFAIGDHFATDHQIWLYYTASDLAAPGGCVNRVSRFTMMGDLIDRASEVILVDGISSVRGNHNGGDLEIGNDGYLYISIGDAGANPRDPVGQVSGANQAAQDLSLLNGKILRVDPMTGFAAPGNPLAATPGSTDCRVRGNTPATPATPCREIYAWGLRNPYRFAFDPNTGHGPQQRFFVNDVGLNTREEVDLGALGANYGWPVREGICPQAADPPCPPPAAGAGFTEPITDYSHAEGQFVTGGAFVPDGFWPAEYDGGYFFGDGGSGKIWLRRADGTVDYGAPFVTGAGGLTDMAFVVEQGSLSLYYAVGSSLRRITRPMPVATASGPLAFRAVPLGTRVLDSREPVAGDAPLRAGSTRYLKLPVDGAVTRAALVNMTMVEPVSPGFLTAWAGRTAQPLVSNVNGVAGEVVANAGVVPLDADGGLLLFAYSTADVVIDVLGWFDSAPGPVGAGRFTPVSPNRIADTREPLGPTNSFSRPSSAGLPIVRVPVGGRGGVPPTGASSVALTVTALGRPGSGGFVSASAGGIAFAPSSNIDTNALDPAVGDVRANLVVVALGEEGTVDLHVLNTDHVVVDVVGWFGDDSQPASTAGLFVSTPLQRMVDTREGLGFGALPGGQASTVVAPPQVPANASALAHNVTIVNSSGPGFVTPFPGGDVPLVSAGNVTAAGQVRAVLSFTRLGTRLGGPPATMSYFTYMATDLVVDVAGYFTPG